MLSFNPSKGGCTGCAACYSACPVHCISMKEDEEGFLYPESNEACIDCGLCEKVCPNIKPKHENPYPQKAFAALTKDAKIWQRSASGGAFSEVCRHWADEDTLIVGAAWDGLRVHHIGVKGFDEIGPLCKSKYVNSAIEDTFIEIQEALKAGQKAIFCGCPCQVAGLKTILRKDYDNLLTIDLICHGSGSPSVFEACMKNISDFYGEKVVNYQFRAKRKYYEKDYISSITTEKRVHYVVKDPYMQLFLSQNALRPSCGKNCKYRDSRRPGDLTLADFKGLTAVFPDLIFQKRNWSTIVCNTKKGEEILAELGETMQIRPCPIEAIIKHNPLFAHQTWFSEDRDAFFRDFIEDKEKAISKWTVPPTTYKTPLKKAILAPIPTSLLKFVSKFFHKIGLGKQGFYSF